MKIMQISYLLSMFPWWLSGFWAPCRAPYGTTELPDTLPGDNRFLTIIERIFHERNQTDIIAKE